MRKSANPNIAAKTATFDLKSVAIWFAEAINKKGIPKDAF